MKKVVMLGAYAVGKTSLVRRFVSSQFDERYHATIGVKVDKKRLSVDGEDLQLLLWDVAGAEDEFSVPASYIRGSHGVLFVVDGTRPDTLDRCLDLAAQVDSELGRVPLVIALNKSDLSDEWRLDDPAIDRLHALEAPVLRSSARSGEGVEEAFRALAERLMG